MRAFRGMDTMSQILSITFEAQAQRHCDGQFSVPTAICEQLHLGSGDDIRLVIASGLGTLEVVKPLSSGLEIYGPDVAAYVKAGDTIRVTAARVDETR
jgi:hypothetical protein